MDMSSQVVLVTGANRGLGAKFAAELVARGAKVYGGARRPEQVTQPGVVPVALDLLDRSSIAAAAAFAGDVTVLINNAGTSYPGTVVINDEQRIRDELETHLFGTLAVTRAFAPVISGNGGGSILNVLSVLSWVQFPSRGAYPIAKAAEWSLTNALRLQLVDQGISVSALHVGYMDTDMTAGIDAPKTDPAAVARQAVEALEAGSYEILADDLSRNVRQGLAGGVDVLYPDLALATATSVEQWRARSGGDVAEGAFNRSDPAG